MKHFSSILLFVVGAGLLCYTTFWKAPAPVTKPKPAVVEAVTPNPLETEPAVEEIKNLYRVVLSQQDSLKQLAELVIAQGDRVAELQAALEMHEGLVIGEYDTANPKAYHLSRRDFLERRGR